MTRSEARQSLNAASALIAANVADYCAGRIDRETFSARQYAAHDAIKAAGQQVAFARRWRSAYALTAR